MSTTYWIIVSFALFFIGLYLGIYIGRSSEEHEGDESCPLLVDPLKDYVKCMKCKCLLKQQDASKVFYSGYGFYEYFCQADAPAYSRVEAKGYGMRNESAFFGEVEVDALGVPVGYTKKK